MLGPVIACGVVSVFNKVPMSVSFRDSGLEVKTGTGTFNT